MGHGAILTALNLSGTKSKEDSKDAGYHVYVQISSYYNNYNNDTEGFFNQSVAAAKEEEIAVGADANLPIDNNYQQ